VTRQSNLATPERMTLIALPDPYTEGRGHRPGSPYIERVWLSALGPASTWLWTRTARVAATRPATVLDMADLAASLGLSAELGPKSTISRTLARMVWFDTVRRSGDTLAVRTALPDLPARRLARLPASARIAHQHLAKGPAMPTMADPSGIQITEGVAL
jgi:hypothetical protein